eukprot:scaffold71804_cov42-Phaeocystis_antarctica.AAC.1
MQCATGSGTCSSYPKNSFTMTSTAGPRRRRGGSKTGTRRRVGTGKAAPPPETRRENTEDGEWRRYMPGDINWYGWRKRRRRRRGRRDR